VRLRLVAAAVVIAAAIPALAFGSASATTKLTAKLSGGVEVPKGSPTGKGTATITISGAKVCWKFTFSGIGTPLASHIHKAPAGKAGPVVVPFGAAFKASGCTTTTAALAKAIVAKPGAYYVNIHNAKYPGGVIRGQLSKASSY
jgi:hypothetical protein